MSDDKKEVFDNFAQMLESDLRKNDVSASAPNFGSELLDALTRHGLVGAKDLRRSLRQINARATERVL